MQQGLGSVGPGAESVVGGSPPVGGNSALLGDVDLAFTQLVDESPDLLVLVDDSGRVRYANQAAQAVLGQDPQAVVGEQIADYCHPHDRDSLTRLIETCRLGLAVVNGQVRLSDRPFNDGMVVEDTASYRRLFDVTGRHCPGLGLALSFRDLTERIAFEEMLMRTQSLDALTRLAGGVAHDFNNLLAVVVGYCELLQASKLDSDEEEMVSEIASSAQTAAKLTNQLLTFGRRQMAAPRVLDLNEFLRGQEPRLRALVGSRGLKLKLADGPCQTKMDEGQLEQILDELISNAVDVLPESGQIEIGVSTQDHVPIAAADLEQRFALLYVCDDGPGMEESTQFRMFDPYFTTKDVGAGRGMGLAVVYGIVKQNHGYILVDTDPGVGARFFIYLPEYTPVEQRFTTSGSLGEPVLLLEPDDTVRAMLTRILREEGYQVVGVHNPIDAQMAWDELGAGLLIADVQSGGPQLAARLRREQPGLPVLLLSTHVAETNLRSALDERTAFLQRPLTRTALRTKLAELRCHAPQVVAGARDASCG